MSWNDTILDMNKFLCLYNVKDDKAFENFEKLYLQTHNDYDEYHKIDDENHLYIFDMSRYSKDLKLFYKDSTQNLVKELKIL